MTDYINGLISVVIPVYNRPELIFRSVKSVLSQTYKSIEVIIVDDGSTDKTPIVINSLIRENSGIVSSVRIANQGPGYAREKGRSMAKGEFIQYLDSDDILLPDKFTSQVTRLQFDPKADICLGLTLIHKENGSDDRIMGIPLLEERPRHLFPKLLVSRLWQTGTPLYRRRITDHAGSWEALRMYEDWIYEAKIASYSPKVCYSKKPVIKISRMQMDRLDNIRTTDPHEHLRNLAHALRRVYEYFPKNNINCNTPEFRSFIHHLLNTSHKCHFAGLRWEAINLGGLAGKAWIRSPSIGMIIPVFGSLFKIIIDTKYSK